MPPAWSVIGHFADGHQWSGHFTAINGWNASDTIDLSQGRSFFPHIWFPLSLNFGDGGEVSGRWS
jgi:hypothetical protein